MSGISLEALIPLGALSTIGTAESAPEEVMLELYEKVDKLQAQLDSIEGDISEIKAGIANAKEEISEDAAKKAAKLCAIAEKVKGLTEISVKLGVLIDTIGELLSTALQFLNFPIGGIIIQYCTLLILKAKKVLCVVKIDMATATKNILLSFLNGKAIPTAEGAIVAVMGAVVTAMNAIGVALAFIDKLLLTIPPNFLIPAQGMCFFMTPKSLMTTQGNVVMEPKNLADSVCKFLSSTLEEAKNKLKELPQKGNTALKISLIAAGAVNGAAAALAASGFNPEIKNTGLSKVNPASIMKSIDTFLMAVLTPEALPKYERLSFANPRFLMWLTLSFTPAGKKTFGLPL